jgi:hypothetical protein
LEEQLLRTLDAQELGHWPERLNVVVDDHPEHGKGVEGNKDGDIVHYGDIEVSLVGSKITVTVFSGGFKDESDSSEDGLDLNILYGEFREVAQ